MPDINFGRSFDRSGNVVYFIGNQSATGNKSMANVFEKTFLSNIKFNDIFGNPYGGNALDFIGRSYNPEDVNTLIAMVSLSVDQTSKAMNSDPQNIYRPNTEKLKSAYLVSVDVTKESSIAVRIKLIPIEKQSDVELFFLF
jgi:hypothetical protein